MKYVHRSEITGFPVLYLEAKSLVSQFSPLATLLALALIVGENLANGPLATALTSR